MTSILIVVFAYLTYVNTREEQARRKAATIEVSTAGGEPATATITVTAKRAPVAPPISTAPVEAGAPATLEQPTAADRLRDMAIARSSSKLFAHGWHWPLSNRDVWLQQVAGTPIFVVRDVTGPLQEPIGYGTVNGNAVRINLRITKEAGGGEYVKRDAALRLTLSDDGKELAGDFRGEADAERGPVLWLAAPSPSMSAPPSN